ncbi:MAG TPA: RecX family transcriptional regulator [Coprothermobacter sp.]|nr:RecX family transcriptional regulator [Coprothermobacter sp.]
MNACDKFWAEALRRLSRRDYSTEEILSKVPLDCRAFVLERINSYFPNLNERVFQSELRRTVNHGKGPLYLKNRLRERKLSINEDYEVDSEVWAESLEKAMEKARRKYSDREKVFQFLLRQGFTYEMVSQFMKEVDM